MKAKKAPEKNQPLNPLTESRTKLKRALGPKIPECRDQKIMLEVGKIWQTKAIKDFGLNSDSFYKVNPPFRMSSSFDGKGIIGDQLMVLGPDNPEFDAYADHFLNELSRQKRILILVIRKTGSFPSVILPQNIIPYEEEILNKPIPEEDQEPFEDPEAVLDVLDMQGSPEDEINLNKLAR